MSEAFCNWTLGIFIPRTPGPVWPAHNGDIVRYARSACPQPVQIGSTCCPWAIHGAGLGSGVPPSAVIVDSDSLLCGAQPPALSCTLFFGSVEICVPRCAAVSAHPLSIFGAATREEVTGALWIVSQLLGCALHKGALFCNIKGVPCPLRPRNNSGEVGRRVDFPIIPSATPVIAGS